VKRLHAVMAKFVSDGETLHDFWIAAGYLQRVPNETSPDSSR
jgi:hypothetical protein